MNRLRLRTRLLLAVLIPILLTASTLAWLTVSQLRSNGEAEIARLRENLLEARKQELKSVVETARSMIQDEYSDDTLDPEVAKNRVRDKLRAVDYGNHNYIFAYTRDSYNLVFRPKPSLEGYSKTTNEKSKQLLSALFKAGEQGGGFHRYTWKNPASGREEPKISYAVVLDKWNWVIGTGVYIGDIEQAVATASEVVNADISAALTRILLLTVMVVVIGAALGILVGRTVSRPLARIQQMMRDIASGDGDLTQRLPAEGQDELSELGGQFNAFVGKIQETIRAVGQTTDQVASAAEELSRVADETRASVEEQGSETDQIASAITEMAATIHQISRNASEVQGAGSDADRLAREGGQTISASQQSVSELSRELQKSAEAINALAERSNSIQSVLDVIHEVTDQTNLLALNAAIEAARAGEHGRGFAVVADEVRQLARRSGESANQIRTMIDGFIDDSRGAVDRMRASETLSDEAVDRINHATDTLKTIERSVEHIHDQVTQIATAAEEQSQVAEEINQNVVRIVEAAQRSDTGVNQTHESSQELARLGETLRQLVSQFRV